MGVDSSSTTRDGQSVVSMGVDRLVGGLLKTAVPSVAAADRSHECYKNSVTKAAPVAAAAVFPCDRRAGSEPASD